MKYVMVIPKYVVYMITPLSHLLTLAIQGPNTMEHRKKASGASVINICSPEMS